MSRALIIGFGYLLVGCSTFAQKIDTLLLYKGGPNYALKKGFTSYLPHPTCSEYQTDLYYDNAIGINLYHSGKTQVGDSTFFSVDQTAITYSLNSTVPVKKALTVGLDTILTQQATRGEIEIVEHDRTFQPYILITGPEQPGNYKTWTKILCTPTIGGDTTILTYQVIIEDKPQVIKDAYTLCPGSPIFNLYTNIDKSGGRFYIGSAVGSLSLIPNGLFDPSKYAVGKYTIRYTKAYANDSTNSTMLSFTIEVGNTSLGIKASPDTIQQGDSVFFQANSTLIPGDKVISTEWDFGDKTPFSHLTNPFHYYIDTGIITVSVKQTTKLGCSLSFSKKAAVYINPFKIEIKNEARGPVSFTYALSTKNDFRLYPNPVQKLFQFSAYIPLHQVTLSLHRLLDGQKIFEQYYPSLDRVEMDMEPYPIGLYLLQLRSPSGEEKNFKLIKE